MPQDGRYVLGGNHPDLELRVSTLPSVFGEKVVMRILDRGAIRLELDRLRMSETNLTAFKGAFSSPNGLVLLTGPTGSGKTTTLYAAMNAVNEDSINLITVEDPVEYDLPGTVQVQVDTKAGRTFAQVLRAVLRQDPDVIMIGEIRDQETAGIAVQAALTGHLVLSTLHTNTALGAVTRLLDMGVEPYLLGPSLRCVVAQRLVPRICPDCAVPDQPTDEALATFGATDVPESQRTFRRGAGCPQCRNKGKRGRVPIHEVLVVDTEIGRAISRSTSDTELAAMVERKGRFVSMARDGLLKACQGLVTLEDVAAVTRED
ncbi:MAG: type II/IV secretion system protein [Planctomycetes bacterium]|nr:type II/IV secretion system protein [Planctomycetota bacterium]